MKKNQLAKVMKYEIRYLDGCADFHAMQENVWLLQRQTREILNRTIQIAYHWDYTSYEHFKKTGEYLDIASETGYKRLDGYIYDCLKGDYADMSAANMNATIQKAWSKYTTSKSEVLRGNMSIPSYKKDQPLVIHKDSVRLSESDHQTVVNIFYICLFWYIEGLLHYYSSRVDIVIQEECCYACLSLAVYYRPVYWGCSTILGQQCCVNIERTILRHVPYHLGQHAECYNNL